MYGSILNTSMQDGAKAYSPRGVLTKMCCGNKIQQIYRTASKWKWDFNKVPKKRKCDFNKIGKQSHLFNKKVVPKNFAKFTGKHLRQSLL